MADLILPGNAGPSDVRVNKNFSAGANYNAQGNMVDNTNAGIVITPGTSDQAVPAGITDGALGSIKVKGDANHIAGNIKAGITDFGVLGAFQGDFFGDGSDGALAAGQTISAVSTDLVIKQYTSFNLPAGQTLTVNTPCKGLVIYSQGDIVINGTIDMSSKAAIIGPGPIRLPMGAVLKLISLNGGTGGNAGTGAGGSGGSGRKNAGNFGGGGSGASGGFGSGAGGSVIYPEGGVSQAILPTVNYGGGYAEAYGANGFNGGGGGSGFWGYCSTSPKNGGIAYGGGGGGAGSYSNSNTHATGSDGGNGDYAGGFVVLIAKGNIIINSGATINVNGGNGGTGGNGSDGTYTGSGNGGGGAGGGCVGIYYKGTYTNSGTIQVNGGAGGVGGNTWDSLNARWKNDGVSGNTGGVGTVYTEKLS